MKAFLYGVLFILATPIFGIIGLISLLQMIGGYSIDQTCGDKLYTKFESKRKKG